jgi:hypothetical protein
LDFAVSCSVQHTVQTTTTAKTTSTTTVSRTSTASTINTIAATAIATKTSATTATVTTTSATTTTTSNELHPFLTKQNEVPSISEVKIKTFRLIIYKGLIYKFSFKLKNTSSPKSGIGCSFENRSFENSSKTG